MGRDQCEHKGENRDPRKKEWYHLLGGKSGAHHHDQPPVVSELVDVGTPVDFLPSVANRPPMVLKGPGGYNMIQIMREVPPLGDRDGGAGQR